jgi:hypothetical protein
VTDEVLRDFIWHGSHLLARWVQETVCTFLFDRFLAAIGACTAGGASGFYLIRNHNCYEYNSETTSPFCVTAIRGLPHFQAFVLLSLKLSGFNAANGANHRLEKAADPASSMRAGWWGGCESEKSTKYCLQPCFC